MTDWWPQHRERVGSILFFGPWLAIPALALLGVDTAAWLGVGTVLVVAFVVGGFILSRSVRTAASDDGDEIRAL